MLRAPRVVDKAQTGNAAVDISLERSLNMPQWARRAIIAAALTFGSTAAAQADPFASQPAVGRSSSARLIAGDRQPDGTLSAALEIDLAPKTITYWRSPGETGAPPTLDFSASQNVAGVETSFAAPKHIEEAGSLVAGYDAKTLFPLRVTPRDPKAPVALDLKLDYAACDKICLPVRAHLTLTLAPDAASPHASEIARVVADQVPRKLTAAEAKRLFALKPSGAGAWRLDYVGPDKLVDLFAEGAEPWFLDSARDGAGFALTLYSSTGAKAAPKAPVSATLTLVTDKGAIEAPVVLE
jgi:DsbC/DsbD-like thiol-disulfide interchange protein